MVNRYRIAVVEDQIENREQINEYIRKYAEENNIIAEVIMYHNGQAIVDAEDASFDLILFDVDMPIINGMDAAKHIRKRDKNVEMIFVTNLSHYAIEGYSVGALDYILKPINYSAFALRFARALDKVKKKENKEVILNSLNGIKRINTNDIYYLEIENRKLYYHTKNGVYTEGGTLLKAEEDLEPYHFTKCNQYCLINLKHVSEINGNVVVVAGKEIEISRRKKTTFVKAVTEFIGGGF